MRRVKMARAAGLLLASVLLASSVTGCGGKESASSSSQTKITKKMSASETITAAINNTINADGYRVDTYSNILNIELIDDGHFEAKPIRTSKLDAVDFSENPIIDLTRIGFINLKMLEAELLVSEASEFDFSGLTNTRTIVKYQEAGEEVFLYANNGNMLIEEAIKDGRKDEYIEALQLAVKNSDEQKIDVDAMIEKVDKKNALEETVIVKGNDIAYFGSPAKSMEYYLSVNKSSYEYLKALSGTDERLEAYSSLVNDSSLANCVDIFTEALSDAQQEGYINGKVNSVFHSIDALSNSNIDDFVDYDMQYKQLLLGMPYRHYIGAITKLFDEYDKKNKDFDFVLDMVSGEDYHYSFEVYLVDYLKWYHSETDVEIPTEKLDELFSATGKSGIKLCIEFVLDGNHLKETTVAYSSQGEYQMYLKEVYSDVNVKSEYASEVDEFLAADNALIRKIQSLKKNEKASLVDVDNDGIYELYLDKDKEMPPYVYNGNRYTFTTEEKYRNYDGDDLVFYDRNDLLAYLEEGVPLPPKELIEALEAYQEYVDENRKIDKVSLMYLDDGEIPYLVYSADYEVYVAYYKNGRVNGEYLGLVWGSSCHELWYCYDTQLFYFAYSYHDSYYCITRFNDGVGTVELSGYTDYDTEFYVDSNPRRLGEFHSKDWSEWQECPNVSRGEYLNTEDAFFGGSENSQRIHTEEECYPYEGINPKYSSVKDAYEALKNVESSRAESD